jgi:hypothetical protein
MNAATGLAETLVTRADITLHAKFFSPNEDAISFYFCASDISDNAHLRF